MDAPLRVLLSHLQETLLEDPDSHRTRHKESCLSMVWQQRNGAEMVLPGRRQAERVNRSKGSTEPFKNRNRAYNSWPSDLRDGGAHVGKETTRIPQQ